MHLDISNNVMSFGDHRLSSIAVEVQVEHEGEIEMKKKMTFVDVIK